LAQCSRTTSHACSYVAQSSTYAVQERSTSNTDAKPPFLGVIVTWLLRDTKNHDGRGVHDADDDPGEPDGPIGEVSPIIGKVPGTPGRFALHNGPRALRVGGS